MPSCSCWECKDAMVSLATFMCHDDRARWSAGWSWTGHVHPGLEPAHETMEAANTRIAEDIKRLPREMRYYHREMRAASFNAIDVYVRSRVRDGLEDDPVLLGKFLKSSVIEEHRQ
jgi:hypothetical protein